MDEGRFDRALARWREETADAQLPAGLADAVERAVREDGFVAAVWALRRPALLAGAIAAGVSLVLAASSAQTLAREAADYALSRAP